MKYQIENKTYKTDAAIIELDPNTWTVLHCIDCPFTGTMAECIDFLAMLPMQEIKVETMEIVEGDYDLLLAMDLDAALDSITTILEVK